MTRFILIGIHTGTRAIATASPYQLPGRSFVDLERGIPEVLLGTYGHHHPDFLHGAANAITSMHRVSVVESVVDLEDVREKRQKA